MARLRSLHRRTLVAAALLAGSLPCAAWAPAPGLNTKLLDVDKADVAISGYASDMIAPAMIQRDGPCMGFFGLAVNSEFHSKIFLDSADQPRPENRIGGRIFRSGAIVGADTGFSRSVTDGAHARAKGHDVKIVGFTNYDFWIPAPRMPLPGIDDSAARE